MEVTYEDGQGRVGGMEFCAGLLGIRGGDGVCVFTWRPWSMKDDDGEPLIELVTLRHEMWTKGNNMSQVDHPSHYNTGQIEVIDAIEDWKLGFNLGNTVKYVARAGHKNSELQDLKKAKWYLEREIAMKEKECLKPKS